jgi:NADPH:quinone reductase
MQRFGESSRRYPEEREGIWDDLWHLIDSNKIRPAVFDRAYQGLDSVPRALHDIATRKVWGKAVVQVDSTESGAQLTKLKL